MLAGAPEALSMLRLATESDSMPSEMRMTLDRRQESARDALEPIPFDRRREPRYRSGGFAQILLADPLRTFLGGAMAIADISLHGIGLESDHPIEPGAIIEVRLAPFNTRGRVGMVVSCTEEPDESPVRGTSPEESVTGRRRRRLGVSFTSRNVAA